MQNSTLAGLLFYSDLPADWTRPPAYRGQSHFILSLLIHKCSFTQETPSQTSEEYVDHISGYCGPAKLTQKINIVGRTRWHYGTVALLAG